MTIARLLSGILTACAFLPITAVNAERLLPPPAPNGIPAESFNYRSDTEARADWNPMPGSAPVETAQAGARKVPKFVCNFNGTRIERASWDKPLQLDLGACRGVRFKLMCPDPMPISGFSVYFRSGKGWYAYRLKTPAARNWVTVEIDKADTAIEDTPAGWSRIDTMRISAWRGNDSAAEFYVADLETYGADARVAIIRGDTAMTNRPAELASVLACAKRTADCLDRIGVASCLISDQDLTAERLKGRRVCILPYNPEMPPAIARRIGQYLLAGGRMISFYSMPPELEDIAGIRRRDHMRPAYPGQFSEIRAQGHELAGMPPAVGQASWNIHQARPIKERSRVAAYWYDNSGNNTREPAVLVSDNCAHMTHIMLTDDAGNKEKLLLAMLGRFMPELWQAAAKRSIEQADVFGPYDKTGIAKRSITRLAGGDHAILKLLERADSVKERAAKFYSKGRYVDVFQYADRAHSLMIRAYCSVQQPQNDEHRAFWCHSPFGVSGMDWDQAARTLAENGFTAVMPNMAWGGVAYYNSEVLPVAPEIRTEGDQIAECLAACRRYGIECHVWKVNWNMGSRTPKEFLEKMKLENRTQVGFDGKPLDAWLCPSHPENRKLEIESMLEIVRNYRVDGIHFDYIRYPSASACFCRTCRSRFEQLTGRRIANWPDDLKQDPELGKTWNEFRRGNISAVVAAVSKNARQLKPHIKISAAVFGNWPYDRDSIGQDWKLWCANGYLDFVCPMNYTEDQSEFERLVARQVDWRAGKPSYPGIGLSTWQPADRICTLINHIKITRKYRTGGFAVFDYGVSEARDILPQCGLGITRNR